MFVDGPDAGIVAYKNSFLQTKIDALLRAVTGSLLHAQGFGRVPSWQGKSRESLDMRLLRFFGNQVLHKSDVGAGGLKSAFATPPDPSQRPTASLRSFLIDSP
jgi:hypothetical protein